MDATFQRSEVDIAPLLDDGEWTGFQKYIVVLVSLVTMFDGIDSQVLSLALPMLTTEWGAPRSVFAPIMAVTFIGIAVGTATGGMAGDRFGRKRTLIASVLIFGSGTLAGALTDTPFQLGVTRVLASFGLGAAFPAATAILAEFTPSRRRSLALTIAMCALPVGGVIVGFMAGQLLPAFGWRSLFAVAGGLSLLLVIPLIFTLPESLRLLLARGDDGPRARAILARLGQPVPADARLIDSAERRDHARAPWRELLTSAYRFDTILLAVSFFAVILSSYVVFAWAPSLFADAGYDTPVASATMSFFSAGGVVGALAGAALIPRFGSRAPMLVLSACAVLCGLTLAMVPLPAEQGNLVWLIAGLTVAGACIPGVQAMLFALAAQVYPTSMRATGVGFAAAFGRLGAVFSAFVGPAILAGGGTAYFGFLAGAMSVTLIALALLKRHVPGTRQAMPRPNTE